MPRLSLPKRSRLRSDTSSPRDYWLDSDGPHLLCVTLIAIYLPEDADRIDMYFRNKDNLAAFFRDCASGRVLPSHNALQRSMREMYPRSSRIRLYVPARKSNEPSCYVTLDWSEVAQTWRLASPRVHHVDRTKGPVKDGVLGHWATEFAPVPSVACGLRLHLSRVSDSGRDVFDLASQVRESDQLYRQLTHCARVCELFQCLRNDRMTVRCTPGKVVLKVIQSNHPSSHEVTLADALSFVVERIDPYAPKVYKPNVIVWGNASDSSLYITEKPRSIQPQVRGSVEYDLSDYGDMGQFVNDVLLSRLLPFIGIACEDAVDIVGLSYDPDSQSTIVTAYSVNRSSAAFSSIPQFWLDSRRRLWIPNGSAVAAMKALLLLETDDRERMGWLQRALSWLGAGDPAGYSRVFDYWRQPLTPVEDSAVRRRYCHPACGNTPH